MAHAPEFVAFDLETTGLSPRTDRVLEIGAVRFDAQMRPLGEMEMVVDPGVPIPLVVQRLCGLHDADIEGAPSAAEGVAQLADFADGAVLIAHGAGFDITFCAGLVPSAFAQRQVLDTLELARILFPTASSHSLPLLAAALGIEHLHPHRALSDAAATHQLFARLKAGAEALPATVLSEVRRVAAVGREGGDTRPSTGAGGGADAIAPPRPGGARGPPPGTGRAARHR